MPWVFGGASIIIVCYMLVTNWSYIKVIATAVILLLANIYAVPKLRPKYYSEVADTTFVDSDGNRYYFETSGGLYVYVPEIRSFEFVGTLNCDAWHNIEESCVFISSKGANIQIRFSSHLDTVLFYEFKVDTLFLLK